MRLLADGDVMNWTDWHELVVLLYTYPDGHVGKGSHVWVELFKIWVSPQLGLFTHFSSGIEKYWPDAHVGMLIQAFAEVL